MRPKKQQIEGEGTIKFCDRFEEPCIPTSWTCNNLYDMYYRKVLNDIDTRGFRKTFKFVVKDGQIIEVID